MRHSIVCRRKEATPHIFRTLELSGGEGGLEWSERPGNTTCEVNVRELSGRIDGIAGGALQGITITSRANAEIDPPSVDCGTLLDATPGVSLILLLPIRIEAERGRWRCGPR